MAQGSKLRVDPGNCFPRQRKQASEKSVYSLRERYRWTADWARGDCRVQGVPGAGSAPGVLAHYGTDGEKCGCTATVRGCARMLAVREEVALVTKER